MSDFADLARRLRQDIVTDQFRYYGGASEQEIADAEASLCVRLPDSYRWFLREFGAAEMESLVYGVTDSEAVSLTARNEALRRGRPALPRHFVAFGEDTEFHGLANGGWETYYCCFDLSQPGNVEPPLAFWYPKRRGRKRQEPALVPFPVWLGAQAARVQEWVETPREWDNIVGWNRYWQRVIADPRRCAVHTGVGWFAPAVMDYLPFLRERGARRILFVGNGISYLPFAFAHIGFNATALDVSTAASDFLRAAQPSSDDLTAFFPEYEEAWDRSIKSNIRTFHRERSQERVEREFVSGGNVQVVTANIQANEADEYFDVLVAVKAVHPEASRQIASRFWRLLRPGGVCLVETLNLASNGDAVADMNQALLGAEFFIHLQETHRWEREAHGGFWRRQNTEKERKRRVAEEEAVERDRLDAGEKMVIFLHGSG